MKQTLIGLLLLSIIQGQITYPIAVIDWPVTDPTLGGISLGLAQIVTSRTLAIEDINNSTNLLPDIKLEATVAPVAVISSLTIAAALNFAENYSIIVGNPSSFSADQVATLGTVLDFAQLGSSVASDRLTNFPDFIRLTSAADEQVLAMKDTILYYSSLQSGWRRVAVISSSDGYGISIASAFIQIAQPEIEILAYRQYLAFAIGGEELARETIREELLEVKNSGARIIVAIVFDNWELIITIADEIGLVGPEYVWFVNNVIVAQVLPPSIRNLTQGVIATFQLIPPTDLAAEFTARWIQLDPTIYPGAGPGTIPNSFCFNQYDMYLAFAYAIESFHERGMIESGERIPAKEWGNTIRQIEFNGTSGFVKFDENGDRPTGQSLLYYNSTEERWMPSATWTESGGYSHFADVVWFSNSTDIPDLDIRPPLEYWSCHSKEKKTDPTGKSVIIHTPDGSDIDDIDEDYYCDKFIDCQNLSDESSDGCETNFLILFIVFGIVTGLLIFLALFLIAFVIVFGIILKYRRIRPASPFFLILILLSMIVGYSSIYAWMGKPHPVACAFQPWLLGLPALSMITALSAKTFRIYRIFKFPTKKVKISNFELLILWCLVMTPALIILILWTIISTPTADMEEHDGKDHYFCTTGGFTGSPGGYIFFGIFVCYGAIILFAGAVITFLSRNIPSQFNESQLIAISIYNLIFLSIVIIPVYLIVLDFNPFIAWILRSLAILYAFTATMAIQFIPITIGIFILDKGKNIRKFKSSIKAPTSANSSSLSQN